MTVLERKEPEVIAEATQECDTCGQDVTRTAKTPAEKSKLYASLSTAWTCPDCLTRQSWDG
jgi:uncharacterized protein with PIN domain